MHACGHHAHTTMLMSAAVFLKRHVPNLTGTVKFLVQSAEEPAGQEGILGVHEVLQECLLDDAWAVFGLHVDPSLPTCPFATAAGAVFASKVNFQATLHGRGGHAGVPMMWVLYPVQHFSLGHCRPSWRKSLIQLNL